MGEEGWTIEGWNGGWYACVVGLMSLFVVRIVCVMLT